MNVLKAIEKGDLKYVKANIDNDEWFKTTPCLDYIFLQKSIEYNYPSIANFFLTKKFSVNSKRWKPENTPLHLAILIKNVELTRALLKRGANADALNADYETPIHFAAKSKNRQILKLLIPYAYSSVNSQTSNKEGLTYMHVACMGSNVHLVAMFLKDRANARCMIHRNSQFWPGFYPLHCAVYNNQLRVAELLLRHDADPNARDAHGITPIHLAFRKKYQRLIESMLNKYNAGKVNLVDDMGISYFHIACSLNDPELLEQFDKEIYDINRPISFKSVYLPGYTPLLVAVHFGACRAMSWLLEHGADFTKRAKEGFTPLHVAFWRKEYELVDKFTAEATKSELHNIPADGHGLTFFHIACARHDSKIIQELIDRGADVNAPIRKSAEELAFCTPLHIATRFENLEIVDLLLRNNANVDAVDLNGETPLHYLFQRNEDKLDMLLEHLRKMFPFWKKSGGTDLNLLKTYLHNTLKILRLLIERKVNVNVQNTSNETPLFHLFNCKSDVVLLSRLRKIANDEDRKFRDDVLEVIAECRHEIVKMMLPLKPDFKLKNDKQYTLLHRLAGRVCLELNKGHEVAQLMIKHGAEVDARNDLGETALYIAAANGYEKLMDVLLLYGADPNARSTSGTPLSAAVGFLLILTNHPLPRVVSKLIMCGADAAAVLPNGRTVLHEIFDSGQFLLKREFMYVCVSGCDLDVRERATGRTPLHCAVRAGEYESVDWLLSCGADPRVRDADGLDCVDYCLRKATRVGPALHNHLRRLELIGHRFEPGLLDKLATLRDRCPAWCLVADEQFRAEIERLRGCSINPYTTLYDLLHKSAQQLSKYVANAGVRELLSRANLCYDLPLYGPLIASKYRKALLRHAILEKSLDTAMRSLNAVAHRALPENVSEKILGYMTDADVVNLLSISKRESPRDPRPTS